MTAFAPCSIAYLIVGKAPTIRWGLVTFFSASRGTLKSTYGPGRVPVSIESSHTHRKSELLCAMIKLSFVLLADNLLGSGRACP